MPNYHIYRSRTGSNIRLEIGDYSHGFTPGEWQLFAANVQASLPSPPEPASFEDEDLIEVLPDEVPEDVL